MGTFVFLALTLLSWRERRFAAIPAGRRHACLVRADRPRDGPVEVIGLDQRHHDRDNQPRQDRGQVAAQRGIFHARRLDGQNAVPPLRLRQPSRNTGDETHHRSADRSGLALLAPRDGECRREDGPADQQPHHEEEPAEINSDHVPDTREDGHGEAEDADIDVRHADHLGRRRTRPHVRLVHIEGQNGADGDELGARAGRDRHEQRDEQGDGAVPAEQRRRREAGRQPGGDVRRGRRVGVRGEGRLVLQRDAGEAQRRGEAERDGEPGEPAEDVRAHRGGGPRGDGALPVGLVQEDGAAAGAELDDAEDEREVGLHRHVAAVLVSCDGALDRRVLQEGEHLPGRSDQCGFAVHFEHEVQNDDHEDERVGIVAQKGRAKAAEEDVGADPQRDQEDGGVDVHAREARHHGGAPEEELAADQDVRHQREENEDAMCQLPVADVYDLQIGVAARCVLLGFAG